VGHDCATVATPSGPAGPTISEDTNPPDSTGGTVFAPYMIERFTRIKGNRLLIDYTMSTWNPYTVVRMRSEFAIVRVPPPFADGGPSPG
jgi:hypothetical protein